MFEESMRMKNSGACLVLALFAAFCFPRPVWSQTSTAVQRVTGKDKAIIIRERGRDHTYDFEDDLQLSEIEQAKLLFQNQSKGKLYLLMYVEGSSTGGGSGPCGAGQEEYLIWQVLDSKWAQDDYKVELIACCFVDIARVASEPYEIKQGKLTSEYADYRDSVTNTLTYDSATAEKAWTIQQKHLPETGQH
jgi:hypothetical protein